MIELSMGTVSELHARDYLAGASMVFGIILIADQVLSVFYGYSSLASTGEANGEGIIFSISLHTISAMISGYLIGRRNVKSFIQAATVVAVLAYLFESIYLRLFLGSFGNIWSLISIIIGGILGAAFAKIQKEKRTLVSGANK